MGNSEKSCRLIRQFSSYSNSCVYRHSQEPTLVFLVLSVSSSTPAAPIFSIVYPESEGPFPSGSSKCLPGSQGLQYTKPVSMGKMTQPEIHREEAFFCQMWLNPWSLASARRQPWVRAWPGRDSLVSKGNKWLGCPCRKLPTGRACWL